MNDGELELYDVYEISIHDADAFQTLDMPDLQSAIDAMDKLRFFFDKQGIKLKVYAYHHEMSVDSIKPVNTRRIGG